MLFPGAEVTRSLPNSNFLKGGYTKENGQRVIDYNEFISRKIDTLRKKASSGELQEDFQDGFITGLDAKNVGELIGEDTRILGENPLEEFATDVSTANENPQMDMQAVNETAENILNEAKEQASAMVSQAQAMSENLREEARKEGYNAGYIEGNSKGYGEGLEKAESQYAERFKELEQEKTLLCEERKQVEEQLKPKIIETILDVIGQVTGIVYENNKDILIHLINRVLQDVEASNEYVIHVSKEDYEFVVSRQSKLYCATAKDVNIEVTEDRKLTAGKCMIETDGGIFDCSLDVQMEQLIQDIRLLAGV